MTRNRLSPSRRREDVRAWWAEHLAAQRKSGQSQAAYCRAQGCYDSNDKISHGQDLKYPNMP